CGLADLEEGVHRADDLIALDAEGAEGSGGLVDVDVLLEDAAGLEVLRGHRLERLARQAEARVEVGDRGADLVELRGDLRAHRLRALHEAVEGLALRARTDADGFGHGVEGVTDFVQSLEA